MWPRRVFIVVVIAIACWSMLSRVGTLTFYDIRGKRHTPLARKQTRALVFVFVDTDCPIANYYQPTLANLAIEYAEKHVPFFLVHSDPSADLHEVRKHADEFQTRAPVILDAEQKIARRLDAKVTPEAFVVNRQGETVYRGRINDWYVDLGRRRFKPTTRDLKDAIDDLLAGREIECPVTKAIGCYIPYFD